MEKVLTDAIEDYLKAIYDLTLEQGGRATTNQIAERLNITPASVSGMIKRMSEINPPLLIYKKHHGVELTDYGERAALEIIRHHRLLELFLHQTLGYTWDEVHAEADRLEHVISEDFEERMAQALGDPKRDPHGEPIPSRDLKLPPSSKMRLSDLRTGQAGQVEQVEALDLELLRYLSSLSLVPGARFRVLSYSAFDDNLRLQVEGEAEPVVLGARVTSQVFVRLRE